MRLSKNDRVLALIATMAVASFTVGAIVFVITDADAQAIATATTRMSSIHATAASVLSDLGDQESALDDYVLSTSEVAHQRYLDAAGRQVVTLAQLRGQVIGDPQITSAVDEVGTASLRWRERIAAPVVAAVAAGDAGVLSRFAAQAGSDHLDVDQSVLGLGASLDAAAQAIDQRKDGINAVKVVGIGTAFGFLLIAFGVALVVVRRFGRALEREAGRAGVLVRFTEVTSFADDDREIASANLIALDRIARPDASVTHLLNRSMDRALPEVSTGDAPAEILSLHGLGRCAGMMRGTLFVAEDLSDALTVHCPVYPATSGTLACVPLVSGEAVGAVHLYWRGSAAFPLDIQGSVSRIAEHAALAIGNRRLLAALHGQANTDPRTGLVNSRAFDASVEEAMGARAADEAMSVLMLDVDYFKRFNDKYGHPAGDEALKAFASVLRSCMREGDIAARYGGEEFAVFLPGIGPTAAASIAERIRARTEATVIGLAPGSTARITISIGTASAPEQGADRMTLLRLADEALYEAKSNGRNTVAGLGVEMTLDRRGAPSADVATAADIDEGPDVIDAPSTPGASSRRGSRPLTPVHSER